MKQKIPIYLLWIILFFLPILNSKTLNCLFLQKELRNLKALPPSFFKLTCVLTVDNAVRTSHKLSWRSLILLNTLWAHAVKRNMLQSRECLTQRGTTSSKSSNDGAPLLTSDLSKRIALGEEENIPCMVLKPQRISWKLSFLKGTSVGYMNRHHGFSIKARSVQCVCVYDCRDTEASYEDMSVCLSCKHRTGY